LRGLHLASFPIVCFVVLIFIPILVQMFFIVTLTKSLLMHPSCFGPKLHEQVRKSLYSSVEGTVDPRFGFIVMVAGITAIPAGEVQEGGFAKFEIQYNAIVYRPIRNEIVEGVVAHVDQLGIRVIVGAMTVFIYKDQIPSDMAFDANSLAYAADDAGTSIKQHSRIRLRLTGVRFDAAEIFGVGTIKEDFLGYIGD